MRGIGSLFSASTTSRLGASGGELLVPPRSSARMRPEGGADRCCSRLRAAPPLDSLPARFSGSWVECFRWVLRSAKRRPSLRSLPGAPLRTKEECFGCVLRRSTHHTTLRFIPARFYGGWEECFGGCYGGLLWGAVICRTGY